MSLALLNSFVARCICDPPFLAGLLENDQRGSELLACGLGEEASALASGVDLQRLRQFAGFIAKVQNHDVIALIPQTSALLRHYGLELRTFIAFRGIHQRLRAIKRLPKSKKAVVLLTFLAKYVAGVDRATCPGLGDVLRHERLLWEAGTRLGTYSEVGDALPHPDERSLGPESPRTLVPRVRGFVHIGNYSYDPLEVCEALASEQLGRTVLAPAPCSFAYWADPTTRSVRLFRVSPSAAAILSAVNGRRCVAEIVTACRADYGFEDEEAIDFIRAGWQSGLLTTLPA